MLNKLVIPENTKFEEGSIIIEKDAVIGAGCSLGYGIIGRKIVIGEKTTVEGDLVGDDLRLDAWCDVKGNVVSKGDAYLADFTTIHGKLTVYGDLEIGRNVKIKEGFEAKGLITIQSPLPVLIFLFVYLLELLRLGKLEEAEKLFEEIEEFENPFTVPNDSMLNLEVVKSDKDVEISGSRVLGNVRGKNVCVEGSEVFGSIRGTEILIDGARIHGAIEGTDVYIINGSEVFGHVKADRVHLEEKSTVEGALIGKEGVWIRSDIEISKEDIIKEEIEESVTEEKEEVQKDAQ
ncbi:MAG TPA: acyltransferase [Archaeoglobaceae archaeon]|nr:acyltransferase [Archaeoglobaceae archaeon]